MRVQFKIPFSGGSLPTVFCVKINMEPMDKNYFYENDISRFLFINKLYTLVGFRNFLFGSFSVCRLSDRLKGSVVP